METRKYPKNGYSWNANVGKSTTFNCMCKLNVPAENYPFCTIDPNIGSVAVHDERNANNCRYCWVYNYIKNFSMVPGAHK